MNIFSKIYSREYIRNTLSSESDCFHYLPHKNYGSSWKYLCHNYAKDTPESRMHRIAPFKQVFSAPNPIAI